MATIAKLAVQITANADQFKTGVAGASHDLQQFSQRAVNVERSVQPAGNAIQQASARSEQLGKTLMRLAPSFDIKSLVQNTQTAEQALGTMGHAASGALMSFGPAGAAAGIAIGGVIAGVLALSRSMTEAEEAGLKAFGSVIDGTKTLDQAITGTRLDVINKGFKDLLERAVLFENLTTNIQRSLGQIGNLGMAFEANQLDDLEDQIAEVVRQAEIAADVIARIAESPGGRALEARARAERATGALEGLEAEIQLRRQNIGLTESQIRLERIYRDRGGGNRMRIEQVGEAMAELEEMQAAWERYSRMMTTAADSIRSLQADIDNFNLTPIQSQIRELLESGDLNAMGEAMALQDLADELDSLKLWQDMIVAAGRVVEHNLSPLQKYEREMEHLRVLLDEGMLAQDDFALATARATDELLRATEIKPPGQLQAAEEGTSAAISAIQQDQAQQRAELDVLARVENAIVRLQDIEQQQLFEARRLADAADRGALTVVR